MELKPISESEIQDIVGLAGRPNDALSLGELEMLSQYQNLYKRKHMLPTLGLDAMDIAQIMIKIKIRKKHYQGITIKESLVLTLSAGGLSLIVINLWSMNFLFVAIFIVLLGPTAVIIIEEIKKFNYLNSNIKLL